MSISSALDRHREISWINIIASLTALFLLRATLENYTNKSNAEGDFISWFGYALHIPLSYFAIFLSFLLILRFISKSSIKETALFLTFSHILVILPPLIDMLRAGNKINTVGYLIIDTQEIFSYYVKALLPGGLPNATFGMTIAVYLLFSSFAYFIFIKTKNIRKVFIGLLYSYTALFAYAILPSFLLVTFHQTSNFFTPKMYFGKILQESWVYKSVDSANATTALTIANDIMLSQVYVLIILAHLLYIVFSQKEKITIAITGTIRIERFINFFFLAFIGMLIANNSADIYKNPVNIVTLVLFTVLLFMHALLAAAINDMRDIAIDKISNAQRPLASGRISIEQWKHYIVILVISIAITTAALASIASLFLILIQGIYFTYSADPFRFKRHYLSASLLIGLTTVAATMAGFFLVAPEKNMGNFPILAIALVGFSQALLSNMKDLKDYIGDKNEGIKTLPVVFGLKRSKQIISILYSVVFMAIPIAMEKYDFLFFAAVCSSLTVYIFLKTNNGEKPIFYILFLYMLGLFLSFF